MNELQQKYTQEAIDLFEKGEHRRRLERKQLVEYLAPIELGILGAAFAALNVDVIGYTLLNDQNYSFLFKIILYAISISFFSGICFLFAEKKVFDEEESIKAFKKLDMAEANGKPKEWFLALAELTNRRALPSKPISSEYTEVFRAALEKHKNDLKAWKYVSNPEQLYSTQSKETVELLIRFFLLTGIVGVALLVIVFTNVI